MTDTEGKVIVLLSLADHERTALDTVERTLTQSHPLQEGGLDLDLVRGWSDRFAQYRDAREWFLASQPPF